LPFRFPLRWCHRRSIVSRIAPAYDVSLSISDHPPVRRPLLYLTTVRGGIAKRFVIPLIVPFLGRSNPRLTVAVQPRTFFTVRKHCRPRDEFALVDERDPKIAVVEEHGILIDDVNLVRAAPAFDYGIAAHSNRQPIPGRRIA